MNPRRVPYYEAKQLLKHRHTNQRAFIDYWEQDNKHEFFWVFEGDTLLDELCLEPDQHDMDVLGVIIKGNLKAGMIWTDSGEGTVHLVVLGHLTADNIIIGGQDLYVEGNLEVNEIFMGCYNHGSTFVTGNVKCGAIIVDDYGFATSGKVEGQVFDNRWIYRFYPPHEELYCPKSERDLKSVFHESVLKEYGVEPKDVVERLRTGKSALL